MSKRQQRCFANRSNLSVSYYTPPNRRNSNHAPNTKNHNTIKRQEEEDREAEISYSCSSSSCDDVPFIAGTCPFMCPEEERLQRERLRDLSVFERLYGNPRKSSPNLAVKKFCRTIYSKNIKPSDIRPLPVLEDTMNYLLSLLDSSEHPFDVIHNFISDRTRSIRQDLGMQNMNNDKTIDMYEKMVKFHIISHHKLQRCSTASVSSAHYLNMEQLKKTLTTLYNLYDINRVAKSNHKNEAEFRSIYVLLHLNSSVQLMGESLSLWLSLAPSSIMKTKEMCFARKILRCYRMSNFKRFFAIIAEEASYLQYCIIEPYINEVRVLAVSCINKCGYKVHPYPLGHLSRLLMMEDSDVESLCNACNLETHADEEGNKLLPTKQTTFYHPKGDLQTYSFLGSKRFESSTVH